MYCPKCGQQVSDSARFCSRCGLLVSEVAEWLAGGGNLIIREEAVEPRPLSPRRKGMRRGAKMMFWGAALLPILFGLSIAFDAPFPLLISFILILAGLTLLVYSRLFADEIPSDRSRQARQVRQGTGRAESALPPAADTGVISDSWRQSRTAEMAQPPSVTEPTTKLLERDGS